MDPITLALNTLTGDYTTYQADLSAKTATAGAVVAAQQADIQAGQTVAADAAKVITDKSALKAAIDAAFPDPASVTTVSLAKVVVSPGSKVS